MNTSEIQSFGEELRKFREQKRMSQDKLAQIVGVTRQTLNTWELGKNPPKDRTHVLELAKVLDLDNDDTNTLLATAFLDPLPPWHVPYHRNPLFTGREELLQDLRHRLIPGATVVVSQSQAISGLGGIGKTQVALEYAYRYQHDYSAIVWLQADSREIFSLACIQLAQELNLPAHKEANQARILAAIKRWFKNKTKWLVILDNVEDFSMIEEFLPPGHHGCVLLTTRAHHVTEHIALAHKLEGLPEEEGALLLLRRAGRLTLDAPLEQAALEDYDQAKRMWELVEGFPLALDQIGAYVSATGCSLARYCALYMEQKWRLDLLKERGEIPPGHPESVAITFSVAFEKINIINPAAIEMLKSFAFLYPKAIPEEIIIQGKDHLGSQLLSLAENPLLFDQAINILLTYSLVHRDAQKNTLSIHRLVQVVFQDTLEEAKRHIWVERMVLAVNTVFPESSYETWQQCERLLLHALQAIQWSSTYQINSVEVGNLLQHTASYLQDRIRYEEAEPLYQRALHIREKLLGPDHPDVTDSLDGLASLRYDQGKYIEAEPLYQRALSTQEKQLGSRHSNVAYLLNQLANLYNKQGKYTEAESFYQRALYIREDLLGAEHLQIANSLDYLAVLYKKQGKYKEAEALYQRVLQIQEKQLEPEHPQTTTSLYNFAILYDEQGKYKEAEALYQRVLQIREKQLGPEHPQVAYPLNCLAILYKQQGKEAEAELLYRRVLQIWEQSLGDEHPQVAYPLNGLADLYKAQGKYEEAEPLCLRALQIWEQQLGPDHVEMSYPLNSLASLYQQQGRYKEAESLYQQALLIWRHQLGEEHPNIAISLCNLASLYHVQRKYIEAESLYQQALQIWEQQWGSEHSDVANALSGLAGLYSNQGKYQQAESFFQRALSIQEQQLGPEHPDTATILHDFASFHNAQGNIPEAYSLYQRALAIREQIFRLDHPKIRTTQQGLLSVLQELGQHEEMASLQAILNGTKAEQKGLAENKQR
jgi:tetratricopeptide (TPR) repeat protein/transcriptional regulator with XRE-family HTH domain